jgi:hypothetical protein
VALGPRILVAAALASTLEPTRVLLLDAAEQAGQAGELGDGARAVGAPGQVLLELPPVGGGQGAEDVGAVVVREAARHDPTPSSWSASLSARSA